MIKEIIGDIFEQDWQAFLHQANTECTLGNRRATGIAAAVQVKFPKAADADKKYYDLCHRNDLEMLGTYSSAFEDKGIIINLYGQRMKPQFSLLKRNTSYDAFENALVSVSGFLHAIDFRGTLAMPYLIACDKGGGDWEIVRRIIDKVLGKANFDVIICKLEK